MDAPTSHAPSRSPTRRARATPCGSTSWCRRSAPGPRGSPRSSRERGSGSTGRSGDRSRRRVMWPTARPERFWSAAGSVWRRWRSGAGSCSRPGSPRGCFSGSEIARTPAASTSSTAREIRLASEDGHTGHHGFVTDLLAVLLEGDDAHSAAIYACGPPAMLEAVRGMCAERGVACELAMEAPMACGFGACFGCAIPVAPAATSVSASTARSSAATRSRRRWCRDRATRWSGTAPFSRIRISQRNSVVSPSAIPSSTARGRSTQSRLDGHSAIGCWRSSRSRPSSRRRSPRSRGPATRHRASGRRPPG